MNNFSKTTYRDVDVAEIEGKSQAAHHALREVLKARYVRALVFLLFVWGGVFGCGGVSCVFVRGCRRR